MTPCTLIIAEKPDAAKRIASALSSNVEKKIAFNITYFELERDGKKICVAPASGHAYTIAQEFGGRNFYPVFNFIWLPKYLVEKGDKRTQNIISLFKKLSGNADEFINATDYDIEGSLIGYMIAKYACGGKDAEAKRMKFSTLTKEELVSSYENMIPHLDFEMVEAGMTRHEVDWLYGVNLSRALTLSATNYSKKYNTLSIGRVQGPTLNFIIQREAEINSFVPLPYWEIKATANIQGKIYEIKFEKNKIETEREAIDIINKCAGKEGEITDIEEKESRRSPPDPFDLGSLQRESYRFFNFTPRRTLQISERLYLNALISYPRTSSQKLPQTIKYDEILKGLLKNSEYTEKAKNLLCEKELIPKEGKKEDPAHPAVYPTGIFPEKELMGEEKKIYDLIVRRFMAVFGKPSVRLNTKVKIEYAGFSFYLYGGRIIESGWMDFYSPYVDVEEVILPSLKIGDRVPLNLNKNEKFTEPPPRYNPASLLKKMEENNLGTKATRAEITETLFERGYIRDERIVATDIGFAVIETLDRFCRSIISVELTRDLEEKLDRIERNFEKRENILLNAVDELKTVLNHLKNNEKEAGRLLAEAIQSENLRKRIIGVCPQCSTGNLIILRSRKTLKRFIGCTNFFKGICKMALPLPQHGIIHNANKLCKVCNWPMIIVKPSKGRPFQICVNINCQSKKLGSHL